MIELIEIQKRLKAPKGQFNEFGKYKYRSCEDILEALKPLLYENKCALTINDDIVSVGNRVYVKATVTLKNETGETTSTTAFAREEEIKKGMDSSQITGSTSSYARKYALNGMFCIDDTKDSDSTDTGGHEPEDTDYLAMAIQEVNAATTVSSLVAVWSRFSANMIDEKMKKTFQDECGKKRKEIESKL